MDLAQLQRAFQRHLLDADATIASAIASSERVPAGTRLGIYADAYRLRLIDALAANYPRLQQLLGTEAFGELAQTYLREHPSKNTSVRWFGDQLAGHLVDRHGDQPALAELAAWEWAIANAFDAADTPPLTEDDLSRIEPDQWPTLRFRLHSSARLLSLSTNAPALFKTLSVDEIPPAPESSDRPHSWLIWRQDLAPHYRPVAEEESALLQRLVAGATFEALCELLCEWHEAEDVPARAAIALKGWIREQLLIRAAD
ncbi:hypothetical protein HNQ60_003369 [Povalibacter uvarum]|uniref:Putative DNA-binding domain-containing protein n=1 Tax=Povalibacter uvarum TaxID=732238 RepID=A0A841HR22_9GAMM|nr:putative DNA-binding domain-containing protein [Povalibacter uvarum]MBB6094482.1 hypothetical protein [Povalibacter uvarum]